jgi:uncharacterized protein YggE
MKHKPFVKLIVGSLIVAMLAACMPTTELAGDSPEARSGGITVIGRGEAFGQPDEAYVNVGVETFAEAVSDATTQNEATIRSIVSTLQEKGIAAEDIQTSNYSLWAEQYYGERGPEGIVGYRVSNQVSVVIRDIEKVGDVLTAVTEAGANSIYGVSFLVADPAALQAEAREKAIADAQERAASLAQLSNVTLGPILSVSEVSAPSSSVQGLGGGAERAVAEAPGTSISPGQLSYHVQVEMMFAIQ